MAYTSYTLHPETHFRTHTHPAVVLESYPHQLQPTTQHMSEGVSILRKDLTVVYHTQTTDPGGRYAIWQCTINKQDFTIVNIYSPNANQRNFLHSILAKVDKLSKGVLIICRDFNHIFDPTLDITRSPKTPNYASLKRQCKDFACLMASHGLNDVWRVLHLGEK
ncbi:Hypothetical predicted protein [Pelobates cultripes]|uniref:Endonuclease/exonuclease/phosphatase domain-containing protein n=1 Tax=Pelobates cultripes TaxID=61616 RepID=A0AAD1WKK7_PELCU|nr:Hypothetical predicted protein [Pelobates cultripes]